MKKILLGVLVVGVAIGFAVSVFAAEVEEKTKPTPEQVEENKAKWGYTP